ncbi:MAG: CYTH domain-containing protein [Bdellovibrionales bacterium]|jgi:adenylate cyclase|nr:CYTH domain-containing protein [Bdellovibrionales bacterium]
MGVEIERKFLVTGDDWKQNAEDVTRYVQGYLSREPERTVRVRIAGEKAFLTIKGQPPQNAPLETPEFEYAIPKTDAEALLKICLPGVIDKTRYRVPHAGKVFEVDVFSGENSGLTVAEIELSHSAEAFDRPAWLGAEVTEDLRYKNASLSVTPFCKWPKP